MQSSLSISDLSVQVQDTTVVSSCNLEVQPGSIHAIMGPNGSGKSSLAQTVLGNPAYTVTSGFITCNGLELNDLSPDKRAQAGVFVAFQYPVELPGVLVFTFLKESYQALVDKTIDVIQFKELLEDTMELLGIDQTFAHRYVNVGFSGGEKKMLELLQMVLLKPKITILDEIDSGLDVDALKKVARGITLAREENPHCAVVLITHYQRILEHITPDWVHIMYNGALVDSGSHELAQTIEQQGYREYRI